MRELDAQLLRSEAEWKLVVGHHPIRTNHIQVEKSGGNRVDQGQGCTHAQLVGASGCCCKVGLKSGATLLAGGSFGHVARRETQDA